MARRALPLIILVVAIGVLVYIAADKGLSPSLRAHAGPFALSFGLGALVGASELVSRYRDQPMAAIGSDAGLIYLGLNGLVSGAVYGILVRYGESIMPGIAGDWLMTSIVAGFGAMAVLRSKFFTIRTEKGEDIAVGPDAAVAAFLAAADRGVDRARASRRLALVFGLSREITRPAAGEDFLQISLAAFQNLSEDEKTTITQAIDKVAASELPDDLKLQAISYGLLGVTGERNFKDMMGNLKQYVSNLPDAAGDDVGAPDAGAAGGEGEQPPPDDTPEPVEG